MAFVNRHHEMQALEREYARRSASLVVACGRRRVGKTRLVSEFIKDKRAPYYLASEESEPQNLASFKAMAADFLGSALLGQTRVERREVFALFSIAGFTEELRELASGQGDVILVEGVWPFGAGGKIGASLSVLWYSQNGALGLQ